MSLFLAFGGAYLMLAGLFFVLFPQRWQKIINTLLKLKSGQFRTVGVLLVGGGTLLLLLGAFTHIVLSIIGVYLMLEGMLPLFAPQFWRRAVTEMLTMPPMALRNIGVSFFAVGGLLLWAA